jgi:uncharacterized protein
MFDLARFQTPRCALPSIASLWAAATRAGGLAVLVLVLATVAAMAQLDFPELTGRVVDQAGILPAHTKVSLDQKLAALERQSSDQLVVVTLPSLQGTDIADYGYQLGRAWGIGQGKLNNGVLLIIAPNERKLRIEVGYGLEGTLTDALSSVVIHDAILPKFREGDMPAGIEAGVDAIASILTNDQSEWRQRAAEASRRPAERSAPFEILPLVVIGIVILIILLRMNRASRSYREDRVGPWGRSWGRRRGGWPSGPVITGGSLGPILGGGGSSGGGGFSGGGGSFGGGGSSGSW